MKCAFLEVSLSEFKIARLPLIAIVSWFVFYVYVYRLIEILNRRFDSHWHCRAKQCERTLESLRRIHERALPTELARATEQVEKAFFFFFFKALQCALLLTCSSKSISFIRNWLWDRSANLLLHTLLETFLATPDFSCWPWLGSFPVPVNIPYN